jgi:hypothetical protein
MKPNLPRFRSLRGCTNVNVRTRVYKIDGTTRIPDLLRGQGVA